jgi:hypothetical protein
MQVSSERLQMPELQKPGAGLPFFEWLVSKYWIVNRLPYKISWDETQAFFERESQKSIEIFESIPLVLREKRILIDRIPGIEDSSRYWSSVMVLEHLVIVGSLMSEGMVLLSRGIAPESSVGIADVKPLGGTSSEQVLALFKDFLVTTSHRMAAEIQNRESKIKLAHPWFGPMDIHQWHWLMAAHHRIHRKQLEAIRDNL